MQPAQLKPLFAISVLTLLPSCVFAQIQSGTISGTVVDSSGASVPGATVNVESDQTGAKRPATVNDSGGFTVTALPPGGYSLRVEAAGFSAVERTGMVLTANERLDVGRPLRQSGCDLAAELLQQGASLAALREPPVDLFPAPE